MGAPLGSARHALDDDDPELTVDQDKEFESKAKPRSKARKLIVAG